MAEEVQTSAFSKWTTYVYIAGGVIVLILAVTIAIILFTKKRRRHSVIQQDHDVELEKLQAPSGALSPIQMSPEAFTSVSSLPTNLPSNLPSSPGVKPEPEKEPITPSVAKVWERVFDTDKGAYYYYNNTNGQSQWDAPSGFVE